MQLIAPFYLLCLVVLKLTVNAASMPSIIQSGDLDARHVYAVQRLRGPLMVRSATSTFDDASDSLAEDDLHQINKRRYSLAVLGGRSWMTSKKRGPLFG